MELLRKVAEFTKSVEDKKEIYVLYIRSILEQSSVVWHSSSTKENAEDLERVQKCAVKLILGEKYEIIMMPWQELIWTRYMKGEKSYARILRQNV